MNGLQTMPTQEMEVQKNIRRQLDNLHLRGAQFAFRFGTGCMAEQGQQKVGNCSATDNLLEI